MNATKKKNKLRLLSIFLMLCMVVSLMPMPVSAEEPILINTIAVSGISWPKGGSTPSYDFTLPAGANYHAATEREMRLFGFSDEDIAISKNGMTWFDDDRNAVIPTQKLKNHKFYTLVIFLLPNNGYKFSDDATVTLNGGEIPWEPDLNVAYYRPLFRCFSIRLLSTAHNVIHSANVDVTPPIGGMKPDHNFRLPDGANYHIATDNELRLLGYSESTIEKSPNGRFWINYETEEIIPSTQKFKGDETYESCVLLLPNDGYEFSENMTMTVNGNQTAWRPDPGLHLFKPLLRCYGHWKATFPEKISSFSIRDVDTPRTGEVPDYDVSVASYGKCRLATKEEMEAAGYGQGYIMNSKNGVIWLEMRSADEFGFLMKSDTFMPEYTYRVGVFLVCNPGYVFDDPTKFYSQINGKEAYRTELSKDGDIVVVWGQPQKVKTDLEFVGISVDGEDLGTNPGTYTVNPYYKHTIKYTWNALPEPAKEGEYSLRAFYSNNPTDALNVDTSESIDEADLIDNGDGTISFTYEKTYNQELVEKQYLNLVLIGRYGPVDNILNDSLELEVKKVDNLLARPNFHAFDLTYKGEEQTTEVSVIGQNKNYLDITGITGKDAGTYTAKATPRAGYTWYNGKEPIESTWEIRKAVVSTPRFLKSQFDYKMETIDALSDLINYDKTKVDVSGVSSAKNIGNYTFTLTLKDPKNYCWTDGSSEPLTFNWSIVEGIKHPVNPSYIFPDDLMWTGELQTTYCSKYDPETMDITGNTGTDVGEYEVTLTSKTGQWNNGYAGPITGKWKITPKIIKEPVRKPSYNPGYTGKEKDYREQFEVFEDEYYEFTSDSVLKAIEPGTYSYTIQLKDKVNYQWSYSKSTDDIKGTWEIWESRAGLISADVVGGHGTFSVSQWSSKWDNQTKWRCPSTLNSKFDFSLSPDAGYEVDKVYVNESEVPVTGNTFTVTLQKVTNVTITYKKSGTPKSDFYSLTATILGGKGHFFFGYDPGLPYYDIKQASRSLPAGTKETILFKPYDNKYEIGEVLVNGASVTPTEGKYDVTMDQDTNVTVSFVEKVAPEKTYSVTVKDSYASIDGSENYKKDETVTINAGKHPSGYSFAGWATEDGVKFADPSSTTTTFKMPEKDVTVKAVWTKPGEIAKASVTVTAPKTGEKPSTTATATDKTYKASPGSWYPNDDSFESDTAYKVTLTLDAVGTDKFTEKTEFYINGNKATLLSPTSITGFVGQVTLSYTFPKTEKVHTHSATPVAAKDPTCTAPGNKAFYMCNGCNKFFKDSACKVETDKNSVDIPATGHSYGPWSDNGDGTHKKICDKCKDVVTEAHKWNYPEATKDHDKRCTMCGYLAQAQLSSTLYIKVDGNGIYTKGSGKTLEFISNGLKDDCTGIKIDDKVIADSNYTLKSGSTIIILKNDYLETLGDKNNEDYKITVMYKGNKEASTTFKVQKPSSAPGGTSQGGTSQGGTSQGGTSQGGTSNQGQGNAGTGQAVAVKTNDENNTLLWFALLFTSLLGVGATIIKRRNSLVR